METISKNGLSFMSWLVFHRWMNKENMSNEAHK